MRGAALVTGASRNIGRGIALALAKEGRAVACFGRDREALEQTAALIREAGGTASVHTGDVAVDADLEGFAADAAREHGGIGMVVNNAGIMREARAADTTPQAFRDVINANLVAAFVLSRAAHPYMRDGGGGVVVNIGSMFGGLGVPAAASYCASKAGIEGLSRSLAAEWARDSIRVVTVAPGYVRSDISAAALDDPELSGRLLSRIPLRRVGEPEEVGDLVAFLSSPKAAFISGETFVIDGGQRMHV
jgi:NAD(P)-dependent dehydrogenase (short-subunit alcohol dehydrogenase family)